MRRKGSNSGGGGGGASKRQQQQPKKEASGTKFSVIEPRMAVVDRHQVTSKVYPTAVFIAAVFQQKNGAELFLEPPG